MNQDYQEPSARLTRRSFNHERLARINQDPFEVPTRSRGRISESPRRFFNYVKDKVQGAVSGLQKLLNSPRSSQAKAMTPVSSYQLPPIAKEKLSDISLSISQTISKPEFQRHYGVDSNKNTPSKTSFLGVMNFYKDVSGEKIREKMRESNTLVIPPLADSVKKPVSLVSSTRTVKESIRPARRYRDQSDDVYRSESLNLNGKRSMPSILSKKEKKQVKKVEEEKKVRFVPGTRKTNVPYDPEISFVRSNSSMIRYISSDEDEDFNRAQKKLFNDEQTGIIKDPPLKISIIKKIKVNPFQKSRVEKTSVSEYLRSVKGSKGKGFDKFLGGKLNENSYGSDNILNDSKIETDSDDSSLLHNNFESRNFNNYKGRDERDEELSEVAEEPFPGKVASPILEHVEEQDIEKEESEPEEEMKEPVVQVEKKVTPVQPEPAKPAMFSGLFGQKEIKPIVEEKNVTPVAPVENIEPAKPKLFSFGNNTLPKEPVAAPIAPQETIASSKPSAISQLLQSVVEDKNATEKKDEIVPSAPITEANKSSTLQRSGSLFSEDALKNPLFANLVNNSKPSEPAMDDNPFLSKSIPRTLSFTNIIGGTIASAPKTETVQEKPQATETAFNNPIQNTETNSSPFTSEPKPTGILGILQRSQSIVSDTSAGGSSIFNNTLKPVGSFSWMGSNNTESQPGNNLFGNLANNNNAQTQSTQPQGGVFGGLFANNNNNNASNNSAAGSGMAFEGSNNNSGNSMMGEAENNNNNNTGSLFGGNGGMSFGNNNSGASAFGGNSLFQNSGSSSVFGGTSINQSNNSNPFTSGGMGGGFQSDSSNPFLSQGAGAGAASGSSGLFGGNNQSSGFGGGNTNFGSGKKGKNQRERAF